MIPSFVGLLVVGLGLLLLYVGIHGGGFLTVHPRSLYDAYGGMPSTTDRNPT